MTRGPIATTAESAAPAVTPNVPDVEALRRTFTWDDARAHLDGLPDGAGLNIAHEAVDRHAGDHPRTAIRWLAADGTATAASYADLRASTNRFANALEVLGVGAGERVFTMLPRRRELYETAIGTWKHRSVFSPLFSAFGPEPACQRLARGDGRVLVTTPALYQRRIAPIRDRLPGLANVLLAGDRDGPAPEGTRWYDEVVAGEPDDFVIPPTDPGDVALLHFTSGTTGMPKGAIHVHEAVVAHEATGWSALDLHPDDVFWCTADPGWVTGTSYGIIAPLVQGVTSIVDDAPFDAEHWYRVLAEQRVTVWYTAPTALRMMMRAGAEAAAAHDLSALRLVASVGEPLNAEVVEWGRSVFGTPVHDTWWQTETGGIMIANLPGTGVRAGSMGRPLPGVEATVLRRGPDGRAEVRDGAVAEIDEPGVDGELALRPGWPSMFRGYLDEPERYERCFAGGWYLTGDVARRDDDGWFWFAGRADDVIKSAGHLIGPYEVERTLMEHPAVLEAGVIGVPDPVAGETVKAFVTLRPDREPDDGDEVLRRQILGFARKRLGAAVAPRAVVFVDALPHTSSGKILRRLLKARELGLPEGDLSTLERPT